MPITISFTVPSVPVAQPRQRHRVMSMGGKSFAQNYTPTDHPVNAFKAAVQAAAKQAYSGPPITDPICLDLTFVMPRPKKYCRKKDDPGRLPHTSKPDRDNLLKSFCDALNNLTWADDALICDGGVSKRYAAIDEQPCVEAVLNVHAA